jgi:NDP-sugar pyrophosphorylase family protein
VDSFLFAGHRAPGHHSTLGIVHRVITAQLGSGLAFKHFIHLALGEAGPVGALANGTQDIEPGDTILVVQIDVLTAIAPRGDVVEAAGESARVKVVVASVMQPTTAYAGSQRPC